MSIPLSTAKTWSKVRIDKLGLLDSSHEDLKLLGEEVIFLDEKEPADTLFINPIDGKPIETFLLYVNGFTHRLGGDSLVTLTFEPTPAGTPEELSKLAQNGTVIRKADEGEFQFQNDLHPFIWEQVDLYSAVTGILDSDFAMEILSFAISVAPKETLQTLYAAFAQRYSESVN